MNRRDRRAQQARTRKGTAALAEASLDAPVWERVQAAEAGTCEEILARGATKERVAEVVENALAFAEGFAQTKSFLACSEGCHYCCHQKVGSTGIEVVHIATMLRGSTTSQELDGFIGELATLTAIRPPNSHQQVRCPFLSEEGACRIYDYRPLSCRAVTSPSSTKCKDWQERRGPPPPMSDPRRWVAHMAIGEGLDVGVSAHGLQGGFLDFHHAMLTALSEPRAVERWLAGDRIFASASIPPDVRRLPLV